MIEDEKGMRKKVLGGHLKLNEKKSVIFFSKEVSLNIFRSLSNTSNISWKAQSSTCSMISKTMSQEIATPRRTRTKKTNYSIFHWMKLRLQRSKRAQWKVSWMTASISMRMKCFESNS